MRTEICLLLVWTTGVLGLIGYDCGGSTLNITTISLNGVAECDIPLLEPTTTSNYIQLLQLRDFSNAETTQCRVEIDRTIFHCGMHSHNSIVHNGRQVYLHDLDEKACRRVQETGILSVSSSGQLVGIQRNSTTTRSITMAGSVTVDGKCSGAQYSDPFGSWDNVVVQASISVTLSNYEASVNLATDKIVLESGTHCTLAEGHCIDINGNSAFWKTEPTDSCKFSRYDVLYEGKATKITSTGDDRSSPDVYTLTTQDTIFALAKRSEVQLCGYTLIRTEHPKLFILETQRGESFATRKPISVSNLDIFSYINSKFVYVEKHVKQQMKNLYKDILTQRCNLERQVLQNAVSISGILPEKFAYALMGGPGYMAVTAREIAHIVRCIPVECSLRRTKECYYELPVTYIHVSFFLSTTSRMLLKSATQMECNPMLPAFFQIDNAWFRFSPHPIEEPTPQSLTPPSKPTWHYATIGNLAGSGIYSEVDIKRLREHIMFPAEKPALLNNLARGSVGYSIPAGSVSIRGFLDETTLEHPAESAAKRFWRGFEKFGTASAGVFAIYIIAKIVKPIIDTCIHGYAIHSLYGWSIHLLGTIWSFVTGLILTLGHRRVATSTEVEGKPSTEKRANTPVCPNSTPRDNAGHSTREERAITPDCPSLTARDSVKFSTTNERVELLGYPNLMARESGGFPKPSPRLDSALIQRLYAGPSQGVGTASDLRGEVLRPGSNSEQKK